MGQPSGLEGSRCINLSNTMAGVIASDVINIITMELEVRNK